MAYNPESEYPPNAFYTDVLTNAAQDVGPVAAGKPFRMSWGLLIGGAAGHKVIFRSRDGMTTYFEVTVPLLTPVPLPGFDFPGDLEILTSGIAGDVGAVIAYPVTLSVP